MISSEFSRSLKFLMEVELGQEDGSLRNCCFLAKACQSSLKDLGEEIGYLPGSPRALGTSNLELQRINRVKDYKII